MTTVVTLYRLKSQRDEGRLRLACKLAETAFHRGHKVYVGVNDPKQRDRMDTLMWTFSWSSFVPHCTLGNQVPDLDKYPVVIGCEDPPPEFSDVLIPLLDSVPSYALQFNRIADPVGYEPAESELTASRIERYEILTNSKPKIFEI